MPGPVALVGAGEFLAPMAEFDRGLLQATGRPRPRVVILPTASAPDGETTFRRWAEMGTDHFATLGRRGGAGPRPGRSPAAHDAAAPAGRRRGRLVYLSGGNPQHLVRVLLGSPLGPAIAAANARGAVIAGCSAGAMAIVGLTMDFRSVPKLRIPLPFPIRWRAGLGLVDGVAVLPHYNAWPEPFSASVALQSPGDRWSSGWTRRRPHSDGTGLGRCTAAGRVTVWHGRHRERFRKGDAFRL